MDEANMWNSTFELLETALPLREASFRLKLMDNHYHHNPSNLEWDTTKIVMEYLQAFYDATCHFSGSSSSSNVVGTLSNSIGEKQTKLSAIDRWFDQSCIPLVVEKSKLDTYLDEEGYPRSRGVGTFNILDWWKLYSPRLPILERIGRDILVVPATTVASEASISVGGRVLDESRACLLPNVVEALLVIAGLIG
ncbi:hypothetical protein RD792_005499 [Penstemon davidsonii]|uniref:HAT C-terminal dimerisation domain-containing protein n=1 Tax=Penstemon davidsonii TaxID=160366 RepID=A0ABR0DWI4_9LAMI|nr:hypothetical protein RD792_005499 [Penstemon davidsonii]